jgi:hypothetical protein
MLIVEVANREGFKQFSCTKSHSLQSEYMQDMQRSLNSQLPAGTRPIDALQMHQYWQHAPPSKALYPAIITKSFGITKSYGIHKLPAETRPQPPAHTYQYDLQNGTYPIPGEYTTPKPLKYKWRDFAYTDGSVIDTSTAQKEQVERDSSTNRGCGVCPR